MFIFNVVENGADKMLWHLQWSQTNGGFRAMGGLSPWGILQSGDATICLHIEYSWWSSKFLMSTARHLFARLHSAVEFFAPTSSFPVQSC